MKKSDVDPYDEVEDAFEIYMEKAESHFSEEEVIYMTLHLLLGPVVRETPKREIDALKEHLSDMIDEMKSGKLNT